MKKLIILVVLMSMLVACEPPQENAYGGINYSSIVGDYRVVVVPDDNGAIVCSYPIGRDQSHFNLDHYDCEDNQGIFVEGD